MDLDDITSDTVPIVVGRNLGGIYDDEAYLAGMEAGAASFMLRACRWRHVEPYPMSVAVENVPMVDLIAMQYGYLAERQGGDADGRALLWFVRMQSDLDRRPGLRG
jgi:hypothetical protein